jgi:RNA polymerase sigma-70 factor (ECF subfamily)
MQDVVESPEIDERTLVERAVKRDREAYGLLYNKHVSRVYRHVYYMVGNPVEAEDLTAQAFLQGWKAIERYSRRQPPTV